MNNTPLKTGNSQWECRSYTSQDIQSRAIRGSRGSLPLALPAEGPPEGRRRHNRKGLNSHQGIVALEVMVVVVILLLGVTVAVPLFLQRSSENRQVRTVRQLDKIKKAIIGDPDMMVEKTRHSFGFVGDIGIVPRANSLDDLFNVNGLPAAAQAPGSGIWYGWRGPYLDDDVINIHGTNYYTETLDGWGNQIGYQAVAGGTELRSPGADGVSGNGDDVVATITDTEIHNYVSGQILSRELPHSPIPNPGWQVAISYPSGTAGWVTSNFTLDANGYDTSRAPTITKIPIGARFFQIVGEPLSKIAPVNGGGTSIVNFIADIAEDDGNQGELFERTFWHGDSPSDDKIVNHHIPTGGGVSNSQGEAPGSGFMNFTASSDGDIYLQQWGKTTWDDYRVEVNLSNTQGRYFGIFYRMSGFTYVPANPPTIPQPTFLGTGYMLEIDMGGATDIPSAPNRTLRIKKYNGGSFTQVGNAVDIPNSFFNTSLRGNAHQISITVKTNGSLTEHHVRIDGQKYIEILNEANGISNGAAGVWVNAATDLQVYHLLIHQVPEHPDLPFVWWSFEEGPAAVPPMLTAYGFGYLDNVATIIGDFSSNTSVWRYGNAANDNRHGQAIWVNGASNGSINFGDTFDLTPTQPFTISLWLKTPSLNPFFTYYTIMSKRKQGNDRGWDLSLTTFPLFNFGVHFALSNKQHWKPQNTVELRRFNNTWILPDQWYHVVVRYDAQSIPSNSFIPASWLEIFVTPANNAVVSESPPMYTIFDSLKANSQTASGGVLLFGTGRSGSSPYQGYIDEVRFYNRALSDEEVNALFQRDKE